MSVLGGQAASSGDTPPAPNDDDVDPNARDAASTTMVPELNDADYFSQVLRVAGPEARAAADKVLRTRATDLGVTFPEPPDPTPEDKRNTSSAESHGSTVATYHARTFSTGSRGSASTVLTSPSLLADPGDSEVSWSQTAAMKKTKVPSFSFYDKYLAQMEPKIDQPKSFKSPTVQSPDLSAQSLFSVNTRRSYISVKAGIRKIRWRRKVVPSLQGPIACICCRDDFDKSSALHGLPCGHTYCGGCLKVMIQQATTDESKFPPRCCTQPIPSSVLKSLLNREESYAFLKALRQFSTPWEARIFCPNTICSEFIPPRGKIDPKHPFEVECRKCSSRVCIMCKQPAHPIGQECPEDHELNEVLKIGEKSGWRRCYKCRALVELAQGCTHMTCRCKAEFCYLCGAVWNSTVGCPNFCDGIEELERRQQEEDERVAALEAERVAEREAQEAAAVAEAAEVAKAEKRSRENPDWIRLRADMEEEKGRYTEFLGRQRWLMETRRSEKKNALEAKHADQVEKMQERHAKTAAHLEERQIEAEMELRATLKQSEKSINIRLKHMEAYCDGLGRTPESGLPRRVVTERNLRELGQQYNLRDSMARLHQSKINVLRERQAKRMEELVERQGREMQGLEDKRNQDVEDMAAEFAQEEDDVSRVFEVRQREMRQYWELQSMVLQAALQEKDGVRYVPVEFPPWPAESESQDPIVLAAAAEAEIGDGPRQTTTGGTTNKQTTQDD